MTRRDLGSRTERDAARHEDAHTPDADRYEGFEPGPEPRGEELTGRWAAGIEACRRAVS